ncbi:hypothetical protein MG293_011143 [Ovis ammon polii]|uniref:Uncharacterized protein n=1 Tax=Ovis ammon polii TaxID=230172 RepID=A0AAD4U5J1_OVIAM|nr:hypothetical protein MG293_011143 [Ovis ammon polii]
MTKPYKLKLDFAGSRKGPRSDWTGEVSENRRAPGKCAVVIKLQQGDCEEWMESHLNSSPGSAFVSSIHLAVSICGVNCETSIYHSCGKLAEGPEKSHGNHEEPGKWISAMYPGEISSINYNKLNRIHVGSTVLQVSALDGYSPPHADPMCCGSDLRCEGLENVFFKHT